MDAVDYYNLKRNGLEKCFFVVDTYLLSIVESPKVATCNVIKINLVVDLLKKCFFCSCNEILYLF
jgi:hypothetical protein